MACWFEVESGRRDEADGEVQTRFQIVYADGWERSNQCTCGAGRSWRKHINVCAYFWAKCLDTGLFSLREGLSQQGAVGT